MQIAKNFIITHYQIINSSNLPIPIDDGQWDAHLSTEAHASAAYELPP